jgi:hypothetical protein
MPSIQDILNVLPGYQAEQQRFNALTNATPQQQAHQYLLNAIQAVGMAGPGRAPVPEMGVAPEVSEGPLAAPGAPVPRSEEGFSLSQNMASPAPADAPATAGTPFHYQIFKDGEHIGYAHGNVKGGTATVNNIYTDEDTLGLSGLKTLREHVRQDFPNVTNFEGYRIGGARWGKAADLYQNSRAARRHPWWLRCIR